MSYKDVTDSEFREFYHDAKRAVVVDFWAPWCGPCKKLSPIFKQVAENMGAEVDFVKINIDENPEVASSLGVRGIPSLFIIKNGEVKGNIIGVQSEDVISRWIKENA